MYIFIFFAEKVEKSQQIDINEMNEREFDMTPNGTDLLATLIKLLAEQEGVKITYTLEKFERREEK